MTNEEAIAAVRLVLKHPAYLDSPDTEALQLAIRALEFMASAQPKNAEDEREHCDRAVDAVWDKHDTGEEPCFDDWQLLVERERAAARAEVEAKYAGEISELTRQRGEAWDSSEDRLQKLLAVGAELVTMTEEACNAHADANRMRKELATLKRAVQNYIRAYNEDEFPLELAGLSNDEAMDLLMDALSEAAQ